MAYETIQAETRGAVGLIVLDRPKAHNALSAQLVTEVNQALDGFEENPDIACIVLTGSDTVFCAGADIKEVAGLNFPQALAQDFVAPWERITFCKKPTIAAVAGRALGGGCELAMMCDIIIAADNAKFGQPEINLGTLPGAGGTQRLARSIGKAKAMEMCLTGRLIDAEEAERANLVARIVPLSDLLDEAIRVGEEIAKKSQPVVALAKQAVLRAFETTLAEGVRFERQSFYATFATDDRREGMAAFTEKRAPSFTNS